MDIVVEKKEDGEEVAEVKGEGEVGDYNHDVAESE